MNNIAKALKSGGVLALLWNLEDREAGELRGVVVVPGDVLTCASWDSSANWVAQVRDLYEVYENNTPQCESTSS